MTIFGIILFSVMFITLWIVIGKCAADTSKGDYIFEYTKGDIIYGIIIGFIVSLIIMCLVLGACYTIGYKHDKYIDHTVPIYSIGLSTDGGMTGSFVLGTGSVKGELYPSYRYFVKDNGTFELREVRADNYKIVCTDSVNPNIKYHHTGVLVPRTRMRWLWKSEMRITIEPEYRKGTIYLPKNSIIQSYTIKL